MSDSSENIFLARVAEQAERFDDMVEFLSKVLQETGSTVNSEERNLLSVAVKNLISGKRAACRTISAIEQNPKYKNFEGALNEYKKRIEGELQADCQRVVDLIKNKVLATPCDGEAKAFFIKMIGDYYRYYAEAASGATLERVKQEALKAYNQACEIQIAPCNPIKLGLALNFSVFHYEVMKNHKAACDLADSAL